MRKKFLRDVLPALFAFTFSGLYSVIDGFFIGQTLGDVGLAAIGFAFPLTALIQATGAGIGIGGAVGISIARGKKQTTQEKLFLGNTVVLLLIASTVMTGLLLLSFRPILVFFGTTDSVLSYASDYLKIIITGALWQLLANGLTPIIRNFGSPLLAMIAMSLGFITNIVLDWLFIPVLGFGLKGAAYATIIGQLVTAIPCLLFILKKLTTLSLVHYRLKMTTFGTILKTGLSPFGSTMAPFFVIIIMNRAVALYGGETAVAAYTIVSYVISFILLMLQGIGDGSQPLMSYYLGQRNQRKVLAIRTMSYQFAGLIALVSTTLILIFRYQIPALFGASASTTVMTGQIFPIFALSFILLAFIRMTSSYFYATNNNLFAYWLVYGEPLITFTLVFFFPRLLGLPGVWFSIPTTYFCLFFLAILLVGKEKRGKHSVTADSK